MNFSSEELKGATSKTQAFFCLLVMDVFKDLNPFLFIFLQFQFIMCIDVFSRLIKYR